MARNHAIQLTLSLKLGQVNVAADEIVADEDLRDGFPFGALLQFFAVLIFAIEIDFGEFDALAF